MSSALDKIDDAKSGESPKDPAEKRETGPEVCGATILMTCMKSEDFQHICIQIIGILTENSVIGQIVDPEADERQGRNSRYQHQDEERALLLAAAPKRLERQHTRETDDETDPR